MQVVLTKQCLAELSALQSVEEVKLWGFRTSNAIIIFGYSTVEEEDSSYVVDACVSIR